MRASLGFDLRLIFLTLYYISLDLQFWYDSAFGSPVARIQGIGYVQELVARLTRTPITVHNTSTNATINDNPILFPLGQSLYVDATHEGVVLNSRPGDIFVEMSLMAHLI